MTFCNATGNWNDDPLFEFKLGMSRVPHECPVCNGSGLVSRPPHLAGDVITFTSSETGPWPCRACDGTGILWS